MIDKDENKSNFKIFLEFLQSKSASEFKFFKVLEDTVREIILFFFQTVIALGLMLFRPPYFAKNISNLQENFAVPRPLTFLAFSAVIASVGFRRFISIFQIWLCTSGYPEFIEVIQAPVWFRGGISEFCKKSAQSFDGISKPDILSSIRQISFPSMLFIAIPITLIALLFGLSVLSLFKAHKAQTGQKIIEIICYSSGYQLVIFAIATSFFSEQIYKYMLLEPERRYESLGWEVAIIIFPLLILYAVLAPVPLLYSSVADSAFKKLESKNGVILKRATKETYEIRFTKRLISFLVKLTRQLLELITSIFFLAVNLLKKVLLISFFIVFSIVLLSTELIATVAVEKLGLVEPSGIRVIQRNQESNE
jgi:hypothetical protein